MNWRDNKMNQAILTKLEKTLKELDEKIEEYASGIMGYQETQYMDVVYEDYVVFLESLKNRLEHITEILYTTNEGLQEKD